MFENDLALGMVPQRHLANKTLLLLKFCNINLQKLKPDT